MDSWTVMCYWYVLVVGRTPRAWVWTLSAFSWTARVVCLSTTGSRPPYPSNVQMSFTWQNATLYAQFST